MDQMPPKSPIQKVSSEKAGALSQGSPPGASGATSHLTPDLLTYTPAAHAKDCEHSQTTMLRLQSSEQFVISRVFPFLPGQASLYHGSCDVSGLWLACRRENSGRKESRSEKGLDPETRVRCSICRPAVPLS